MSRPHTYAQLVRLPAVFTAFADICLGALVTDALPGRLPAFVALLLASGSMYCAGMVWNDFFDLEQDRKERPFRPIPSGRVSPREAARLGAGLMIAGLAFAVLAGLGENGWRARPLVLSVLLSGAIFLYDGWLKRTWAGPLGMGLCRFLNVLLGLAVLDRPFGGTLYLAVVVGVYIVGVTWFARTEARISSRQALGGAAAVMLLGLILAVAVPVLAAAKPDPEEGTHAFGTFLFPYLLVALGFVVGLPVVWAIQTPTPTAVQAAVQRSLRGLVLLDAVLATALVGILGLLILLLLPPALYVGRRLYST